MPACCLFAEQAGFQTENSCFYESYNIEVKAQMTTVNELKLAIESCKANKMSVNK